MPSCRLEPRFAMRPIALFAVPGDRRHVPRASRASSPRALRTRSPILHAARSRGFTLLELLVVIVIVGVLAAALVLAVGGTGERRLAGSAERFQALLGHACSEAELGGREFGVLVDAGGYAFRRLDGTDWQDPAKSGELRPRRWPDGTQVDLARDGRPLALADAASTAPQLVCFSSGELTPFTLTLALGDGVRYRVTGSDDGTLATTRMRTLP
jgi:general secretion pathway protein H